MFLLFSYIVSQPSNNYSELMVTLNFYGNTHSGFVKDFSLLVVIYVHFRQLGKKICSLVFEEYQQK